MYFVSPEPVITRLEEVCVHENPWWSIYFDEVRFPDGRAGRHLRLRTSSAKPGAVVLAVRKQGEQTEVALVRSYRYAQQCLMWEAPRGFADGEDIDARSTAVRELVEETGLDPVTVVELGRFTTDSSIVEGDVVAFLVVVGAADGQADGDETDALAWFGWDAFEDAVRRGEIRDGFTLGALGLLHVRGGVDAVMAAHQHDSH